MTPRDLAQLHRAGFPNARAWSAKEFEGLLRSPHVSLKHRSGGFALIRNVAGESELLTLVVDPAKRRQGIADRLILDWLKTAQSEFAFLEVAADNTAARHLYKKHRFAETGRRKGYYARTHGPAVDAVLMSVALTR